MGVEMGQTLGQEGWGEVFLVLEDKDVSRGAGEAPGWAGGAVPLHLGARSPS